MGHVIPHVPARQWVLSLPIPLRMLLATQPEHVTPVLQVVLRVITRDLLHCAGLRADEGGGAPSRCSSASPAPPVVPAPPLT